MPPTPAIFSKEAELPQTAPMERESPQEMKIRLSLAAVLLSSCLAHGANASVRAAQQALNSAQNRLAAKQQAWQKTQQDLARAVAAHQTATNKLHLAHYSAAQKYSAKFGLNLALAEQAAASRQINQRRDTIEFNLRKGAEYQAAEKDAEEGRNLLSQLSDDKSLDAEQQQKRGSELAARIRRPTELRKQAETRDKEIQEANRQRQGAAQKIAELQPKVKSAIDSDPAVSKAAAEEKKARAALEKEQNAAVRADQDLAAAQGNVERLNQQLQAAIAQARHHR